VASKYISDLTKQTSKVGELRGALQAGVMTESDVYAELGQILMGINLEEREMKLLLLILLVPEHKMQLSDKLHGINSLKCRRTTILGLLREYPQTKDYD